MAGLNVHVDTSSFNFGLARYNEATKRASDRALFAVTNEILRLSTFEVPHDTGALQNSGTTERVDELEYKVGYNKRYAARLHEHPEYHFQKGRKGKYLEDPIKNNVHVLGQYFSSKIKEALR